MIIQFKNRKNELREIKEVIDSKRFEMVVIYGRRRIGKTELILNATKNSRRVYYLATEENNLERFYNICLDHYSEVGKLKKDWEVLFDFLKDVAEVIIIDEFQNMVREDKNILNIFQSIVDTKLKDSMVKLFLLGSSISMITSKVLSYQSPLYGRRTGSMDLRGIHFSELNEFFPNLDIKELIEIYGFADGIPFYLIRIDKRFWGWLKIELRKERTFLRDEVDFLIRYEFDDVSTYKLILEAIANGKTKINEMKNFIKVKRTDITPYLKNLLEVRFIERKVPVTENIKSRKGRYFLSDNFLRFWFRYVYSNLSSIEEGIFDENIIKKDYDSYLGHIFEKVAKEFLIRIKIFKFNKIGTWWYKENEIDIVALNEKEKSILFCECKWQDNVDAEKVTEDLKEKSKFVEWNNEKREEYFAIFAKSFKKKVNKEKLFLFDLEDMERIFKQP